MSEKPISPLGIPFAGRSVETGITTASPACRIVYVTRVQKCCAAQFDPIHGGKPDSRTTNVKT